MDKFDFYTLQMCVDGFGNDTHICSIWKTKEEAEEEAKKECYKGWWDNCPPKIVGGFFGKDLDLAFN